MGAVVVGREKALPGQRDKEGHHLRLVLFSAVPVVVMVSPVVMPVPVVSPGSDPGTPIHHWRRDHDHRRSCDDHWRRIDDRRRRSDDHRGGVDRDTNAKRDPNTRVRGQRQGGNRQACEESTHPEPTVFVLHSVFSCIVSSGKQMN
jgi:hypothetical protein